MKQIICMLLTVIFLFSGCTASSGENAPSVSLPTVPESANTSSSEPDSTLGTVTLERGASASPVTTIYEKAEICSVSGSSQMTMDGNTLYLWDHSHIYRLDGDSLTVILTLPSDTETGEGTSVNQCCADGDRLYVLQEAYQIIDGYTHTTQSIVCYENGAPIFTCEDTAFDNDAPIEEIFVDSNGFIYASHRFFIRILNPDGSAKTEITQSDSQGFSGLFQGGDGTVYLRIFHLDTEDEGYYALSPDGIGTEIPYSAQEGLYYINGTGSSLCYIQSGNTISAVSSETYVISTLMDGDASQIPLSDRCFVAADGTIYTLGGEYDILAKSSRPLYRLTPDSTGTLPENQQKPTLTVAYLSEEDLTIDPLVTLYNESSGEYFLEAVYYREDGMTEAEARAALEADILSGHGPDLIFCSGNYRSLGQRGFLLDLYPYLDADESLSREDLLWLPALEDQGHLYSLSSTATSFHGFFALEDTYGGIDELTYASLKTRMEETGLYQNSRKTCWWLLQALLPGYLPEAVDYAAGTSDFDNEAFCALLELCRLVGNTDAPEDTVDGNEELFESYESWFARHPEDLYPITFDTLVALLRADQEVSDDTILFGLPGMDENLGLAVQFRSTLGICTATENPGGAWSVIRFMMTEMSDYYAYYPSLFRSDYEKAVAKYLDPAGEYEGREIIVNDDGTWYLDGELVTEIGIPSPDTILPAADIRKYADMVENAVTDSTLDRDACAIIKETTQSYFEGDCTTKECAGAVERAVNAYLSALPRLE